jgi:hypothetical protein
MISLWQSKYQKRLAMPPLNSWCCSCFVTVTFSVIDIDRRDWLPLLDNGLHWSAAPSRCTLIDSWQVMQEETTTVQHNLQKAVCWWLVIFVIVFNRNLSQRTHNEMHQTCGLTGLSVRTGVGSFIGKVGGQQSSSLKNCRQIFYQHPSPWKF